MSYDRNNWFRLLRKAFRKVSLVLVENFFFILPSSFRASAFFKKRFKLDFERTFHFNFPEGVEFSFILIGANDGLSFDNFYPRLVARSAWGLALEPSPQYYLKLKVNFSSLKQVRCLNLAIHSSLKKIVLYELNETGRSKLPEWGAGIGSIDKEHLLKFNVNECDITEVVVESISFSELLQLYPGHNTIDYLQIDAEGYDFEILNSIPFDKFFAKMVKFEVANMDFEKVELIRNLLTRNGMCLFELGEDSIALRRGVKFFIK